MRRNTPFTFQGHVLAIILNFLKTMIMTSMALWVATILIARIYMLHNAYVHHAQVREDNKWLLIQCNDPAFFSNLAQHVDICHKVREEAKSSIMLSALNDTLTTSSLCGTITCWDAMVFFQTGGLSMISTFALALLLVVVIIVPTLIMLSRISTDFAYHKYWKQPCLEKGNSSSMVLSVPSSSFYTGKVANYYTSFADNEDHTPGYNDGMWGRKKFV